MKRVVINWVVSSLIIVLFLAGCGDGESASGEGDNQEYTIKFAHVVSPSTAKGKAAEKFGELIEERTDGRIKVEIYPDSQLGSDREIIEQMQSGTVHMNAPFTGVLPTFVKEFEVFDLPFLFEDREHAFKATNGELGDILGEKLESQGMHLLGFWDGGFKHLTNSVHPIETPNDMNELKMRVSQSPLLISQFQAVNAGGVSIDFSELYTALQTGTVDGQENPLSNIVSKKFYEVQEYLTLSSHGYMAYPLVISNSFYQDLPEDLKTAVDEVSMEVTEWQWDEAKSDEEAYLKELNETDIKINELSPEQKEAFKEAMSTVYDEFNKIEDSEELFDAINQ
ncbi:MULTISPECIES: TRAP transporter substrate-binding protein [Oceanobacillus]|uniref:C4-dicarboxylate ABC transporter n=1 Tax=Oceanobacillus kimchii TaxID=746691 RepID=A0ABQ5TCX7_9BACI|nr:MULTISPECIES: TRAP transporter substrate-binding protein [Oceanobacillus]MBT2653201.1 TRAP transporter substrate-binding protein [Oceanobacillus sp. ISL-73]MCT1577802.1 TRAP transporter substrate-binding protein [Oceanobacillus kimchii]MCT2136790.1 TRAP transporter substrate-binding protein [Oceanobacillus kimchii]OEH53916.1 C4-dicarboxylate ABC transporter substrate-binding protein [Oceanobacillus sp. E9]GLO64463.1 C4-dicarboxylate ABC transporter [Oceanobacillus kimchii]